MGGVSHYSVPSRTRVPLAPNSKRHPGEEFLRILIHFQKTKMKPFNSLIWSFGISLLIMSVLVVTSTGKLKFFVTCKYAIFNFLNSTEFSIQNLVGFEQMGKN